MVGEPSINQILQNGLYVLYLFYIELRLLLVSNVLYIFGDRRNAMSEPQHLVPAFCDLFQLITLDLAFILVKNPGVHTFFGRLPFVELLHE